MSLSDDFLAHARATGTAARAIADSGARRVEPEEMTALLEAVELMAGAGAKVLGQLQNPSHVASGEVPPLEELTRLLTQTAHRARIVRNRFTG